MAKIPHRFYLTEEQLPTQWYNLRADMKEQPAPLLNPATGKPVKEEDLYPIFCKKLVRHYSALKSPFAIILLIASHRPQLSV